MTAARACTSVLLVAQDGGYVYARTMEFGLQLNSQIVIVPRNLKITATGPAGKVGEGGYDVGPRSTRERRQCPWAADPSRRLQRERPVRRALQLSGFRGVPGRSGRKGRPVAGLIRTPDLHPHQLCHRDEVRSALPNIYVSGVALKQFGDSVPPVHVSLHDATGKSLAIEYTDGGKLGMYDNPTHVFTNAPPFPMGLPEPGSIWFPLTANVLPR